MNCSLCRAALHYVHGHAACVNERCPMRGANQAPCCDGETAETCPAPSAEVGRGPVPARWISGERR